MPIPYRIIALIALLIAIGVWQAQGYSVWMIALACIIFFAVVFPRQAKALGLALVQGAARIYRLRRPSYLRTIK